MKLSLFVRHKGFMNWYCPHETEMVYCAERVPKNVSYWNEVMHLNDLVRWWKLIFISAFGAHTWISNTLHDGKLWLPHQFSLQSPKIFLISNGHPSHSGTKPAQWACYVNKISTVLTEVNNKTIVQIKVTSSSLLDVIFVAIFIIMLGIE